MKGFKVQEDVMKMSIILLSVAMLLVGCSEGEVGQITGHPDPIHPEIYRVEPEAVPVTGGHKLVLYGKNFRKNAGNIVLIGGVAAHLSVYDREKIEVITPQVDLSMAGPQEIRLYIPDDPDYDVTYHGFRFLSEPHVVAYFPKTLPQGGGKVTITGVNFLEGATLRIGDIEVPTRTIEQHRVLEAEIPPMKAPGSVDLVVRNSDGMEAALPKAMRILPSTSGKLVMTAPGLPVVRDVSNGAVVGDLDRDGLDDVVILNDTLNDAEAFNRLYIDMQGKDGERFPRFEDRTIPCLPGIGRVNTRAGALGDLDGDGDLDLALAGWNGSEHRAYLYRNDGTGCFSRMSDFPAPSAALGFTDLNDDGYLDLVATGREEGENRVAVFLNPGNGALTRAPFTFTLPQEEGMKAAALELGDIDGDGAGDILVGFKGDRWGMRLFLNRLSENGGFTDASEDWLPADEGTATNKIVLRLASEVFQTPDEPLSLFVLLVPAYEVRLYMNTGTRLVDVSNENMPGLNGTAYANLEDIVATDVNGDGYTDLIGLGKEEEGYFDVGDYDNQNAIYLNRGLGLFEYIPLCGLPYACSGPSEGSLIEDDGRALAIGDFDGDRCPDLVMADALDQDRAYLNRLCGVDAEAISADPSLGDTAFVDASTLNLGLPGIGFNSASVAVGDVNGDGYDDLFFGITAIEKNGVIDMEAFAEDQLINHLLLNDRQGGFIDVTAEAIKGQQNTLTNEVKMLDTDHDGDLELIVANENTVQLYRNMGDGTFLDSSKDIPSFLVGAHQILDGDLNGDGYVDLVLLSTDATYTMLNNGRGTFEEEAFNTMGLPHGDTTRAALFDADLDGDLDLFLIQPGIDRMNAELYRNDGSGRMTEVTNLDDRFPSAADLPRSIAVSDADRDGDLDLLIAFYSENAGSRIDLLRNDGESFVRREILHRADAHVNRIAMIDINADGADDLIVLNGDAASEIRTNLLCINDGRANFVDAQEAGLPETIQFDFDKSQGIAFGDLDGDGALDLVVANAGQNRIYLNEAPQR